MLPEMEIFKTMLFTIFFACIIAGASYMLHCFFAKMTKDEPETKNYFSDELQVLKSRIRTLEDHIKQLIIK